MSNEVIVAGWKLSKEEYVHDEYISLVRVGNKSPITVRQRDGILFFFLEDLISKGRHHQNTPSEVVINIKFPTELRKMWTGQQVQEWLQIHGELMANVEKRRLR